LKGLLAPFYHNYPPVNKEFSGLPASDFPDSSGPDFGFNGGVDEGNRQFNYSPQLNVVVGTHWKPPPFDEPD
jgi:hypothetical protein